MDTPFFIVMLRIRKTWLPCGYEKFFHHCSSRQQSAKGEMVVLCCVCAWTMWRRQAAWFPHGSVFGTVRKRLFFVPYQFKAGRSGVFDIDIN